MAYIDFIAKPTNDCNLCCEYCYIENCADKGMMSFRTLENLIRKSSEYMQEKPGVVSFTWHGGEPTLAGIDFFKESTKIQKKYFADKDYNNGIQTNGTLLSDELVSFFKENKFGIGLSIDGPKEITVEKRGQIYLIPPAVTV